MPKSKHGGLFAPIGSSAVKRLRREWKMNQKDFWTAVGVTQSGGSRYEGGREMPKPVRAMVRICHIWGLTPNVLRYAGERIKPGYALAAMIAGGRMLKLVGSLNKRK